MNILEENCYIKLPNTIYDDLSITNEELTILVLLYRNYMQYKSVSVSSIQMLADMMYINTSNNRKIISTIKDSITSLIEKEYIANIYDLHYNEIDDVEHVNKDLIFFVEIVEPPTENYFVVYDRDINSIFKYLQSVNLGKFNLIRYFIACRRVSNNQCNFGYLTQGKLKSLITDSRTIQKYNGILQDELHLIRFNNNFLTPEKHYCTTFIGKYDDEENFNNQLKVEVESQGLVPTDKVVSNKRRSVKQKINNLVEDEEININELNKQLEEYESLQYKINEDDDDLDIQQFIDGAIDWGEDEPDELDDDEDKKFYALLG